MNISEELKRCLDKLVTLWPQHADKLASYRLSPLLDRRIKCTVGGKVGWTMLFARDRLHVVPSATDMPAAHVDLSEKDWIDVLEGRLGIISMVFAGRCQFPKHERYVLTKMSIVLQSLATMGKNQ